MFKTLVSLFVFAAVAAVSNAATNSGSTNTGLNLLSSNSQVVQSGVQNVNDGDGYGYGFARHGLGYAGHDLGYAGYGLGYGLGYSGLGLGYAGHGLDYAGYGLDYVHPGYVGGAAYHGGYLAHPGYVGYGYGYGHGLENKEINSKSTNSAMNVMSTDSNVVQSNVQNVQGGNKYKY